MTDNKNDKRRRNHRLSVDIPVKIRYNGITVPGKSANLSCGGIFVRTHAPLPEDAQVEVELPLPDGNRPLEISSEVVWRHPSSREDQDEGADFDGDEVDTEEDMLNFEQPPEDDGAGSGFKFQSLSPEEKERITKFIKRLMRQDTH